MKERSVVHRISVALAIPVALLGLREAVYSGAATNYACDVAQARVLDPKLDNFDATAALVEDKLYVGGVGNPGQMTIIVDALRKSHVGEPVAQEDIIDIEIKKPAHAGRIEQYVLVGIDDEVEQAGEQSTHGYIVDYGTHKARRLQNTFQLVRECLLPQGERTFVNAGYVNPKNHSIISL